MKGWGMNMNILNPDGVLCESCGRPATGWAFIDGNRYCHDEPSPTCYEQAEWRVAGSPGFLVGTNEALKPTGKRGGV